MKDEIRASFAFDVLCVSLLARRRQRSARLTTFSGGTGRARRARSGFVLVVFIDICSVRARSLAR